MLTLTEWRKKLEEMAGVSTIVSKSDCHNPDFQVWGAYCPNQRTQAPKTPGKKKSKKKS